MILKELYCVRKEVIDSFDKCNKHLSQLKKRELILLNMCFNRQWMKDLEDLDSYLSNILSDNCYLFDLSNINGSIFEHYYWNRIKCETMSLKHYFNCLFRSKFFHGEVESLISDDTITSFENEIEDVKDADKDDVAQLLLMSSSNETKISYHTCRMYEEYKNAVKVIEKHWWEKIESLKLYYKKHKMVSEDSQPDGIMRMHYHNPDTNINEFKSLYCGFAKGYISSECVSVDDEIEKWLFEKTGDVKSVDSKIWSEMYKQKRMFSLEFDEVNKTEFPEVNVFDKDLKCVYDDFVCKYNIRLEKNAPRKIVEFDDIAMFLYANPDFIIFADDITKHIYMLNYIKIHMFPELQDEFEKMYGVDANKEEHVKRDRGSHRPKSFVKDYICADDKDSVYCEMKDKLEKLNNKDDVCDYIKKLVEDRVLRTAPAHPALLREGFIKKDIISQSTYNDRFASLRRKFG